MAVSINIDGENYSQLFNIILDEVEYKFHVYWNDSLSKRDFSNSGWYLSVYDPLTFENIDSEDALIFGGRKLMPNGDVLGIAGEGSVPEVPLPRGKLYCVDLNPIASSEEGDSVGLGNFGAGKRYELWYYTESEIASFGG